MKCLNWIAWIAGIAAGIIVLQAFVDLLFKINLFGVRNIYNYFHIANSLLLIAILCAVYANKCECHKES
ncbi:MAG TPA: hypothetical protein VJ346_06785 [Bacteroidales bacterium]|nr:hypothetical protein [Bacteroidales bacterium]